MSGKPKPLSLKVVEGNPGKRKLPQDTPQPRVEVLPAPEWLSPEAKAGWERHFGELFRLGLISVVDYPLFTANCMAWGEIVTEYQAIVKEGRTYEVEGRNGKQLKTNPRIPRLRGWIETLIKTGSELGMSPVARVRLTGVAQGDLFAGVPGESGSNEFDEFA